MAALGIDPELAHALAWQGIEVRLFSGGENMLREARTLRPLSELQRKRAERLIETVDRHKDWLVIVDNFGTDDEARRAWRYKMQMLFGNAWSGFYNRNVARRNSATHLIGRLGVKI
jgi:hypothetical protein